jgi:hypothetical protein
VNRLMLWLGLPHRYLSTGCLHGDHAYCQAKAGRAGGKLPGVCKFCAAPCRCRCHRKVTAADQPRLYVRRPTHG